MRNERIDDYDYDVMMGNIVYCMQQQRIHGQDDLFHELPLLKMKYTFTFSIERSELNTHMS